MKEEEKSFGVDEEDYKGNHYLDPGSITFVGEVKDIEKEVFK